MLVSNLFLILVNIQNQLLHARNSVRRIPLLVIFDGIIQSYSKITFANLCMPIHDIINYFTFIYPFNLVSVERKGKNYKHLNISRTKRTC